MPNDVADWTRITTSESTLLPSQGLNAGASVAVTVPNGTSAVGVIAQSAGVGTELTVTGVSSSRIYAASLVPSAAQFTRRVLTDTGLDSQLNLNNVGAANLLTLIVLGLQGGPNTVSVRDQGPPQPYDWMVQAAVTNGTLSLVSPAATIALPEIAEYSLDLETAIATVFTSLVTIKDSTGATKVSRLISCPAVIGERDHIHQESLALMSLGSSQWTFAVSTAIPVSQEVTASMAGYWRP